MAANIQKPPENTAPGAKKTYAPPELLYLAPLEAMAGVCGEGVPQTKELHIGGECANEFS